MSDEEKERLIEAVQAAGATRDEEAVNYLHDLARREKISVAYINYSTDPDEAFEIAFENALEKLDSLNSPEKFVSWFGQILHNTATDMNRKNENIRQREVASLDVPEQEKSAEISFSTIDENIEHQPELAYIKKEQDELIRDILSQLPEEQRICFELYFYDGLKMPEIANKLGCPLPTVKSRMLYAKKSIKRRTEELEKLGFDFDAITIDDAMGYY